MQAWERKGLIGIQERLRAVTVGCRDSMHEPDEQGVSALVTGLFLDNACGADPLTNSAELTVGLSRDGDKPVWFNLADLIALARLADLSCPDNTIG